MSVNVRMLVLTALLKVEQQNSYSNLVLDSELQKNQLEKKERGFATILFYGVIEKKLTLDYNIESFSNRKLGKLSPEVLMILRMGMYQLLYMDSIPESAAVNESVLLCRRIRQHSAGSFVNAVLRQAVRNGREVVLPKKEDKRYQSIKYSLPVWLIDHLTESYGAENALGLMESFCRLPPQYLRVNSCKTTTPLLLSSLEEQGIAAQVQELENCIKVDKTGNLTDIPAFAQGLFHVQDKSSQMCCKALNVKQGMTVLDVCSAPGGKTFTLAQQVADGQSGKVYAYDVYPNRLKLIDSGAKRLGLGNVVTIAADASVFDETRLQADRVLCDVPCSGFGILRKKPEIRYKGEEMLSAFCDLQYQILSVSCRYVKPGGRLVYSTCTLNPRENEQIISRFLQEHSDFEPCDLGIIGVQDYKKTFLPHIDDCDGFFVAAVKKTEKELT